MSKRQLGLLFIIAGAGALVFLLTSDRLGAGQFAGIGPVQRLALAAAGLAILVGLSLLPLGNRPA